MKIFIKSIAIILLASFTSCQSLVEGINQNPNELTLSDVDAQLFLTGAMLANSVAQAGHLNRISGLYSGQLVGFTSLYSNIYGYSLSSAESITTWSRVYIGVIPNARTIRDLVPEDHLLVGISKVLEAHAIGTLASLCGDIPYSQINQEEVDDPSFDGQVSIFNSLISLLDDAITDLNGASNRGLSQDIYFNGNAEKWREAAATLKARYFMHLKDYGSAFTAAQAGISSSEGDMMYSPRGDASRTSGDKNLFFEILAGSRTGDIGTGNSYLMQLIDSASTLYRGNIKTDERARFGYYSIDEGSATGNKGIIEQFEPHRLVTYHENLLILAEAGARTQGFETGLKHLNELRAYLNEGGYLNANFVEEPYLYEAYVTEDFANGGMENPDGIDLDKALLREIIEERYVSGFGSFMPFDDARRLRKSDSDVAVPFPTNPGGSQHPERMPYSDDELNSNSNAPDEDPGIFKTTAVNQ